MISRAPKPPSAAKNPLCVERWMSRRVYTTETDALLIDAFELMRDHRIRHVPVVDGDKLVGIVSDRDVRSALPSRRGLQDGSASLGLSLLTTRISQIMSVMPITVPLSATIRDAAQIMCQNKVGALPVVDEHGKLVGIISAEDVLWAIVDQDADTRRAVEFELA